MDEPEYIQNLKKRVASASKQKKGKTTEIALKAANDAYELLDMPDSSDSNACNGVSQLLLWPDEIRGMPNALARSALFSAKIGSAPSNTVSEPRPYLNGRTIQSLSNIKMMYRGEELYQDDATVFMNLIHIARVTPLGAVVEFSGHSMLKTLNWQPNSEGYARLMNCIERLSANLLKVRVTNGDNVDEFGGSLVRNFRNRTSEGEPLKRWQLTFEPEIAALFKRGSFTMLQWEQRKKLPSRSPLTLWLHSYLATHRNPLPISLDRYQELSNSSISKPYHFKQKFIEALERLVKVNFLKDWHIDSQSGVVYVTRVPHPGKDANNTVVF